MSTLSGIVSPESRVYRHCVFTLHCLLFSSSLYVYYCFGCCYSDFLYTLYVCFGCCYSDFLYTLYVCFVCCFALVCTLVDGSADRWSYLRRRMMIQLLALPTSQSPPRRHSQSHEIACGTQRAGGGCYNTLITTTVDFASVIQHTMRMTQGSLQQRHTQRAGGDCYNTFNTTNVDIVSVIQHTMQMTQGSLQQRHTQRAGGANCHGYMRLCPRFPVWSHQLTHSTRHPPVARILNLLLSAETTLSLPHPGVFFLPLLLFSLFPLQHLLFFFPFCLVLLLQPILHRLQHFPWFPHFAVPFALSLLCLCGGLMQPLSLHLSYLLRYPRDLGLYSAYDNHLT